MQVNDIIDILQDMAERPFEDPRRRLEILDVEQMIRQINEGQSRGNLSDNEGYSALIRDLAAWVNDPKRRQGNGRITLADIVYGTHRQLSMIGENKVAFFVKTLLWASMGPDSDSRTVYLLTNAAVGMIGRSEPKAKTVSPDELAPEERLTRPRLAPPGILPSMTEDEKAGKRKLVESIVAKIRRL